MSSIASDLQRWCCLANTTTYAIEGIRNTCIHTSFALVEYLRLQGLEADVFRAEAHIHCKTCAGHRCSGSAVGWNGDGTRRPKSTGWRGHLAVSCGDYVLDPTLDQMETGCGLRPRPTVFLKPEGWDVTPPDRPWQGGNWHVWQEDGLNIRHCRYRKQIGWKSTPASRPSRWLHIVDGMLDIEKPRQFPAGAS